MNSPKHIVIVAGEESGDIHAANLSRELLAENQNLKISGIGGSHMQEAGVYLISDLARFGVTGLSEVIRHIIVINKAFKAIKAHLRESMPDLLILVDYPGFNLHLAKYAKQKLGIRILYYISPQIWAWKANRIKTIQACIDTMAVILPFEKKIYQEAGVSVAFVGHPLVDKIPVHEDLDKVRLCLNLPLNKKIVALLPGSRRNEIQKHLPVMVETVKLLSEKYSNIHFAIPIANTLSSEMVEQYFKHCKLNISFIKGQAMDVVACSDCVVVASGTASLESALLLKPMCIIYKASTLTYLAVMKLIKVKYLGLCNLLQNQMMVPELLQYDCNPHELSKMVMNLLTNQEMTDQMKRRLGQLKINLSANKADCSIAELVKKELLNVAGNSLHPK